MVLLGKEARNPSVPKALEGVNAGRFAAYDGSPRPDRSSFGLRLWKKRLGRA
jgi:hypothetical protein